MSESNNNIPMRITQLQEATEYEDGMYYAVAKAGHGTDKIDANIINNKIKNALIYDDAKTKNKTFLSSDLLIEKGISLSLESNVIGYSASGQNYFDWSLIDLNDFSFSRAYGYFEYFVLSLFSIGNREFALAITLNPSNFGKLLFVEKGYVNHYTFSNVILTDSTFSDSNQYHIKYKGFGVYELTVNSTTYDIDLKEVSIAYSGISYSFIQAQFGIVAANVSGGINIFDIEPFSNNDMSLRNITPNIQDFNDNSFIEHGTITTYENGVITTKTTEGADNTTLFKYVELSTNDITFKTNAEYIVLNKIVSPSYEFMFVITINSANFGKLACIYKGKSNYSFKSSSILSPDTYNANNTYRVIYRGNNIFSFFVNNNEHIINMNELNFAMSAGLLQNGCPCFGIVAAKTNGTSQIITMNVINNYKNNNDNLSVWNNKKWFVFGDSITAYGYYIASVNEILGTVSTKYGHGGYSYAQLANVYTEMISGTTPDIITLFAGTNDFGHSGTIADMVDGMETIINGLYTAYPKVQLVIITPLQRNFDASQTPTETSGLGPNNLGLYLIDYVEKIREVAEKYSIPCLDFYSMGGINANNASVKTLDGLHPNSSYGDIMGYMIAKYLEGLKPFN